MHDAKHMLHNLDRRDRYNRQIDIIQAFIAGMVFTLMLSMLLAEAAR